MKWNEICQKYPEQWLLVEALQAHSEGDKRILDDISVVNVYPNSREAMKSYKKLHHETPQREWVVLHTSIAQLVFPERTWLGIRGGK